jgi:hypothetical protein
VGLGEALGEATVGRGERETHEVGHGCPAQLLVLQGCGFAGDLDLQEVDDEGAAGVLHRKQYVTMAGHDDAELLVQLTARGVRQRFARLDLASRELPEAAVALMGGAAANEERFAPVDHSGHNVCHLAGLA